MNELFDVEVEEKERRKAAFAWFHKKKISGAKALAIGAASIVALSTPVVLFASRNNSPTASVDTTVASGDYVTTTTLDGESSTSIISGNGKKAKGGKLPVLVLPVRGSAPTGTTTTTIAGGESSTSTSVVAPPAPPIVLSPSSTSVSTTTTTMRRSSSNNEQQQQQQRPQTTTTTPTPMMTPRTSLSPPASGAPTWRAQSG